MTRRQSLVLLATSLIPCRASAGEPSAITRERALMGTRYAITCWHEDEALASKAIAGAFAEGDRINEIASDYMADGELLSLTRHPVGEAVPVSPLLFELLQQAMYFAKKTDGIFDPTIGPFTRLWRESRRRKALPDADALAAARAAVGWRKLSLDSQNRTITCTVPGMRLDLGGIAKGQTADRMYAILTTYGITRSCVTAGGDIRTGEPPPGKAGWNVGIRSSDKNHDSGELLLKNQAVSTSGDLQQFVELDGTRYSHIIDPTTGLGLVKSTAATIVAKDAATSDALATACCIAPPDVCAKWLAELGAQRV